MVRRRRLAKRLWSGFGQSGKDAAARRRRLRVEALEDRRVLNGTTEYITSLFWMEADSIYRLNVGETNAVKIADYSAAGYDELHFDVDASRNRMVVGGSVGWESIDLYSSDLYGLDAQTLYDGNATGSVLRDVAINPENGDIYLLPYENQAGFPVNDPFGLQKVSPDGTTVTNLSGLSGDTKDFEIGRPGWLYYHIDDETDEVGQANLNGGALGTLGSYQAFATDTRTDDYYYANADASFIYRSGTTLFRDPSYSNITQLEYDPVSGYLFWVADNDDANFVVRRAKTDGTGMETVASSGSFLELEVASARSNLPPTLDPIADVTTDATAAEQVITLTGITAGGNESYPLQVRVQVGNPELISQVGVRFDRGGHSEYELSADSAQTFKLADMDGDGVLDVVYRKFGDSNVHWILSESGDTGSVYSGGLGDEELHLHDFNKDGIPDIFFPRDGNHHDTYRLFSQSFLNYSNPQYYSMPFSGGQSGVIADLNNDGFLDYLQAYAIDEFGFRLSPVFGSSSIDYFTTNDQTFGNFFSTSTLYPNGVPSSFTGDFSRQIEILDLNQDGINDVVMNMYNSAAIRIALGNGDGTFSLGQQASTGAGPEGFHVADFDNDGLEDLLVYNAIDQTGSVLLNNGQGGFSNSLTIQIGENSIHFDTGDLNQDGNLDIVASGENESAYLVFGNGDGAFQNPLQVASGTTGNVYQSRIGDINDDGYPDIVSLVRGGGVIRVMLTQPPNTAELRLQPVAGVSGATAVTVTVEDAGFDRLLETVEDNATFSQSFDVLVNPNPDVPLLLTLPSIEVDEDSGLLTTGPQLEDYRINGGDQVIRYRITNFDQIDSRFQLTIGTDSNSGAFVPRLDNRIYLNPQADFHGTASVTVQAVNEDGLLSNEQSFQITVHPVNDRPQLDPTASLGLSDAIEDADAPVGQVGDLVSTLIDGDAPLANFADVDGDSAGISIVANNTTAGTVWYSINNGLAWTPIGPVSDTSGRTLYADQNTRIYFEPKPDFSGAVSDLLTIKAWDRTGGYENGAASVDTNSASFSSQMDTVSVLAVASPSQAVDDSFAPDFASSNVMAISKLQLLANDVLGSGESVLSVTVTPQATSTEGAQITFNGTHVFYQRPTAWFTGLDSFDYTLDDGSGTSVATVIVLVGITGDVFQIELETGRDHQVTLQRRGDSLAVVDQVNSTDLLEVPFDQLPETIEVLAAPGQSNRVYLNSLTPSAAGVVPAKVYEVVGDGVDDEVIITGGGGQYAVLSTVTNAQNETLVDLRDTVSSIDQYRLLGISHAELKSIERVRFAADVTALGDRSMVVDGQQPVNLSETTTLSGGNIVSTTPIGMNTGDAFIGSGVINAALAAATGSLIRATGALTLGSSSDLDGFHSDGRVEVGPHAVTLLDANQADLGNLTTLGTDTESGSILARNGLIIDFSDNLQGYGLVDTFDGQDYGVLLNNGVISGIADDKPIRLNALVKGVGSLDHVVMDGTYSPGLSPTLANNGSVAYGDDSQILIELGGLLPGSQHDQIEHLKAHLGGDLQVDLINGFEPLLGDLFEVLKSSEAFEGAFSSISAPAIGNGVRFAELVDDSLVSIAAIFDVQESLEILSSEAGSFQVKGWDGTALEVRGTAFRAMVNPLNRFEASGDWQLQEVVTEDGDWVQRVSDGQNSIQITGSKWKNFVSPHDINNDGNTSVLDALMIINELSRGSFIDLDTNQLTPPSELSEWPGVYYDTNGDDRGTVLDALLVINELARLGNSSGEGEILPLDQLFVYRTGKTISPVEWLDTPETLSLDMSAVSDFGSGEQVSVGDSDNWYSGDLVFEYVGKQQSDAVDQLLSDESDWLN